MNPDVALFHFFNNWVGVSPLLDWVVRALVNDYAVPTLFALVLGVFWFTGTTDEERRRNQRTVFIVLVGLALTNATIRVLQLYYFRPRPFATEEVRLLFYRPSVSSFPSVPVATMFCYVVGLWSVSKTAGRALLALALAFGLARVIAGVHYPLDVIGGALWGSVCTWLPMRYARWFDPLFDGLIQIGQRLNLA
jgi:undecaprenyl-diphosphatase